MNDYLTEEQQKSQLLAKARGWIVAGDTITPDNETMTRTRIFHPMGGNLYLAPNMALAWDIHLWALAKFGFSYGSWWDLTAPYEDENVQQLFLDKILSLIEKE